MATLSLSITLRTPNALDNGVAAAIVAPVVITASATAIATNAAGVEANPQFAVNYEWSFGDTASDAYSLQNPVTGVSLPSTTCQRGPRAAHAYQEAGTYTVTCTARYQDPDTLAWLTQTASQTITVVEPSAVTGWETAYYNNADTGSLNYGTLTEPFNSLVLAREWTRRHGNRSLLIAVGTTVQPVYESQLVTRTAGSAGATFTLSYGGQTTAAVAYDASEATVAAALAALSNLDAADITVTGGGVTAWLITFNKTIPNPTAITATVVNATGSPVLTVTGDSGSVFDFSRARGVRIDKYVPADSTSNAPPVLKLGSAALATTPVIRLEADAASAAANEVQVLTFTGATGGDYTLTYDGQTTSSIVENSGSEASDMETALRALSNIGATDVTVAESPARTFTITFQNGLGSTNVPQLTLTPGTFAGAYTITTTAHGSTAHTKLSNVVIRNVILDGNGISGSRGVLLATAATPGYHEDIQLINVRVQAHRGASVECPTIPDGSNVINRGLSLYKCAFETTRVDTVGSSVLLTHESDSSLVGCSFSGGGASATDDHFVNARVGYGSLSTGLLLSFTAFRDAILRPSCLRLAGGHVGAVLFANDFRSAKNGIVLGNDGGDTRPITSATLIDSCAVHHAGLASVNDSQGLVYGTAGNTCVRNTSFYENGYANGAAQLVGADVSVPDVAGAESQNDTQIVTVVSGTGNFKLAFDGVPTVDIAVGASAATVEAALDTAICTATGTPSGSVGDVDVTGSGGGPWTIVFQGRLAEEAVPLLSVYASPTSVISVSRTKYGTGHLTLDHCSLYRGVGKAASAMIDVQDIRRITLRKNAAQYMGVPGATVNDPARTIVRFRSASYFIPRQTAQQTITKSGTVTAGTFTLSFTGETGYTISAVTTGGIAWDADAATVAAAVNAALVAYGTSVSATMVSGTNLTNGAVLLKFIGAWAGKPIVAMTVTPTLTGGGTMVVATVVTGSRGKTFADGNVWSAPSLLRGGTYSPFAMSDAALLQFSVVTTGTADWRNGGLTYAGAEDVLDVNGEYSSLSFRNPAAGNFRFAVSDILNDANTVSTGLYYDFEGNTRTDDNPDPGVWELSGYSATSAYNYGPSPILGLPAAGAWNYMEGDVRHIEASEPVIVTGNPDTDVDNRPHKNLAYRDNLIGSAVDSLLGDISNAFCRTPQAGSEFLSGHRTIAEFIAVGHNPDGTLKTDFDLSAYGFLRVDGGNEMEAHLPFGGFKGVHVADGTADTDVASVGQAVLRAGSTMTGPLVFNNTAWSASGDRGSHPSTNNGNQIKDGADATEPGDFVTYRQLTGLLASFQVKNWVTPLNAAPVSEQFPGDYPVFGDVFTQTGTAGASSGPGGVDLGRTGHTYEVLIKSGLTPGKWRITCPRLRSTVYGPESGRYNDPYFPSLAIHSGLTVAQRVYLGIGTQMNSVFTYAGWTQSNVAPVTGQVADGGFGWAAGGVGPRVQAYALGVNFNNVFVPRVGVSETGTLDLIVIVGEDGRLTSQTCGNGRHAVDPYFQHLGWLVKVRSIIGQYLGPA